jgi:superoxide dismutase, Fe-Mn family
MEFNFFKLPYEKNSLEPVISEETVSFHYGKHHRAYYDNFLKLKEELGVEGESLESIILESYNKEPLKSLYNNVSQVFNHDFFWKSLSPDKKTPSSFLVGLIEKSFVSWNDFKLELKSKASSHFASGWAWLVLDGDKDLKIITTKNADSPLVFGLKPLLAIDVWEHSYYVDYRNDRSSYLDSLINDLINWDFVEMNLKVSL